MVGNLLAQGCGTCGKPGGEAEVVQKDEARVSSSPGFSLSSDKLGGGPPADHWVQPAAGSSGVSS